MIANWDELGLEENRYELGWEPTEYMGTEFRSRLEAEIAEQFDSHGIVWAYEPETIGGYTCDFWLPDIHGGDRQGLWLEIKGPKPTDRERMKLLRLAMARPSNLVAIAWPNEDDPFNPLSIEAAWKGGKRWHQVEIAWDWEKSEHGLVPVLPWNIEPISLLSRAV